nr:hypothetical protein PanWU01x14_245710 [Ipomoea batatas]
MHTTLLPKLLSLQLFDFLYLDLFTEFLSTQVSPLLHLPTSRLMYFPLPPSISLSSSASPSDCPFSCSKESPEPKKAASISMISFSLPTKCLFLGNGSSSNPSGFIFSATLLLPSFALKIPAVFDTQLLQFPSLASSLYSWHFNTASNASLHFLFSGFARVRVEISVASVPKNKGIKFFFWAKNLSSSTVNRPKFGFSPWYPMYTSQLRSLALAAGEMEPLANEIRGTGNEKEIRGSVSGPATVTILSIGSSAKSHLSGGGVLYEVLGTSSDWDPQYDTGGEGAGFSGRVALGEMYGDCNAETNAEDGGDGRQESGGEEETILMVRDLGSTAGICLASSAMN